jgi:hypothetical protein
MHVDPKIRMTSNRLQPIFATLGDLPGPCSALPSPIGRTKVEEANLVASRLEHLNM